MEHLPSLPAVAGLLGVIAYAALRYAYSRFYSPLGVLPEEVGIGYIEVLAYAGPSLFILLLAGGFLWMIALLLGWWVKLMMGSPQEDTHSQSRDRARREARARAFVRLAVVAYAIGGLFTLMVILGNTAKSRQQDAITGKRVQPIRILGLEVLSLRAVPTRVQSVDGVSAEALAGHEDDCVLYLGKADGTVVFVAASDVVLRVPDSAVVFEATTTEGTCREFKS